MSIGKDFVWILYLNDMRSSHVEDVQPIARSDTQEELQALMNKEKVEAYSEPTELPPTSPESEPSNYDYRANSRTWVKSFRKGGPLEWFNPPYPGDSNCIRQIPRIIDRSDEINQLVEAKDL
jgi:hypothetical protein